MLNSEDHISISADILSGNNILDASIQNSSITDFRMRIKAILEHEASAAHSRHVIILAIDGIPYNLAIQSWKHAKNDRMRSVFPSTSSTAWLSSLSGMNVDDHGIPGVIFKVEDNANELINIFQYRGQIFNSKIENIFSDALQYSYTPLSILGDLEDYDCSWRELLLQHSQKVEGHKFYTAKNVTLNPKILCQRIQNAIIQSLELHSGKSPCLIWCFIDTDIHVHHHGYDESVMQFLELIEQVAIRLVQENAIVIAHSDHGLIPTHHDSGIEKVIEQLKKKHHFFMGGAGRTRWIYPKLGTEKILIDELSLYLPASIQICSAGDFFSHASLSNKRVGEVMLIAQGDSFLTSHGYKFDHGSFTDREMYVPLSEWRSCR
jgi:Type I phosphodiesterase / nucleotide pyrophosphatase